MPCPLPGVYLSEIDANSDVAAGQGRLQDAESTRVYRASATGDNVDIKRLLHGNDRFSALEVDPAKYQRSL